MYFHNQTDFPHLAFAALDLQGVKHAVCVLKAVCKLAVTSEWSRVGATIHVADVYFGDPMRSSLRTASDLAAYKPKADILFKDPVAKSPAGRPADTWPVAVKIGRLYTELAVWGPRYWTRTGLTWRLSAPTPAIEVPIRYELAYGGTTDTAVFEQNPVGRGFDASRVAADARFSAPQLTCPGEQPTYPDRAITPVSLGPVAGAWMPRRKLAGTFDERWKADRWPLMPADFDFAFNNVAPVPLQYPGFLSGDEQIELRGFDPHAEIRGRLPGGLRPCVTMRLSRDEGHWREMELDTLCIDPAARTCEATFRACFVAPPGAHDAIILPTIPEEIRHATQPARPPVNR